ESARLYPAVPLIARQATEDTNICGYLIPKGTTCVVFLYFLHRDEDVFPEPDKFDPDRFLPENSCNIPEYGYIPFSAGTRSCIGYKFAEIEMKTVICSILRNFTIESLDERDKIQPIMKVALHPSEPIRLRIRYRSILKH
ncbi:Cytochrome P450 4c3, partial [Araneus ventricosus]